MRDLIVFFRCLLAGILFFSLPVVAQTDSAAVAPDTAAIQQPVPAPPVNVIVTDTPNDNGRSLEIRWDLSPDDQALVTKYQVLRSSSQSGPFQVVGETTKGQNTFINGDLSDSVDYFYRVAAVRAPAGVMATMAESPVFGPIVPVAQWFNMNRIWIFIWTLVICGAILLYIRAARSGKELYVRKIAGIDAVEEAIGRATEMGRKVMYIPGIQDMDDVQTIAGVTILGRVARITAENDTKLDVPVSKSLVMVVAREAVREAYQKAGRPDAFHDDMVHYVTDDQFGYAAAIDGMVVRDKPATMFYMGCFFAESLILAETGNAAGAIQIAGTGQPSQLPFFVASCDYTLIGEELFAASAYLSREPKLLGSLKGQDFAKAAFLLAILVGIVAVLIGWTGFLKILEVG
ncbi:MAG: fibronectin type III domain-containing protein [candidate division Zixibacteria bacterium]|nr:fibronectin type III domain-containing protein [candidate division Zixibacteria bacterium]